MAHVAVPVIKLRYPAEFAFNNNIQDLFESLGVWQYEEAFTYTGRITVYDDQDHPEAEAQKAQVEAGLHRMEQAGQLETGQADVLLSLLRKHDWDISFFVDTY